MIRIAAVADVHVGQESHGSLRPSFEHLQERADVLLLAGDLTKCGSREEGAVIADEVRGLSTPVIAVLGNHDYHAGQEADVRAQLEDAGATVLEGESITLRIDGHRVGIAGTKGFGGGFAGACGSDFGEPEMKEFVKHTMGLAEGLEDALGRVADTDYRIALLHYAPIRGTLVGERLEIYPFLGSYLLAEAVDRAGADLVLHGHAHAGSEKGVTPDGIHVRNVALPVIKHQYKIYEVGKQTDLAATAS